MTEQTLEHANEVAKRLRSERDYKKVLADIVRNVGKISDKALFELSVSIVNTTYQKNIFISHEVAEMALNKEIENTIQHIADLEAELDGLH